MDISLCRVVLVETHFPGNLGAVARVMANMGLRDLVLVNPIADRNDRQAREMSTHGEMILDNARIVTHFDDAVADCVLVVGTSARFGGVFRRQPVAPLDEIMPEVVATLRDTRSAALVFGPEPSGLDNSLVTRCQHLITIPTDDSYSALNLAQAVAICLYELRKAGKRVILPGTSNALTASYEMQQRLFTHLQEAFEAIHFLYGPKAEPLMHAIRHLLGKAKLTPMEVQILHGLARQILWFAQQGDRNSKSETDA